jgi:hypothetical protein
MLSPCLLLMTQVEVHRSFDLRLFVDCSVPRSTHRSSFRRTLLRWRRRGFWVGRAANRSPCPAHQRGGPVARGDVRYPPKAEVVSSNLAGSGTAYKTANIWSAGVLGDGRGGKCNFVGEYFDFPSPASIWAITDLRYAFRDQRCRASRHMSFEKAPADGRNGCPGAGLNGYGARQFQGCGSLFGAFSRVPFRHYTTCCSKPKARGGAA